MPPVDRSVNEKLVAVVSPAAWRARLLRLLDAIKTPKLWATRPEELVTRRAFAGATLVMTQSDDVLEQVADLKRRIVRAPLVVVVPSTVPSKMVRRIVEQGANGILSWPDEAFLLAPLLVSLMSRDDSAHPVPTRLAESVLQKNVRLRAELQLGELPVTATVDGSQCRLEGSVSSLLRKMKLVSLVESVPGIEEVDSEGLAVHTTCVDPEALTREIRLALELTEGIDSATVVASALPSGRITLAGTLVNEAERQRVQRVVAAFPGVSKIQDLTTQSSSQKIQDRHAHQRTERALHRVLAPADDVQLAIFGKVGFVSGRVETSVTKTAIEETMRRTASVDRVINEVRVLP